MTKTIEYELTLKDGSKRYEFVDPDAGYSVMRQIRMLTSMHGAVSAVPVERPAPKARLPDGAITAWDERLRTVGAEMIEGEPRQITVRANGGWGELICDPITGDVISYERGGDWEKEGDGYDNITRLDVDEWRATYPKDDITAGHDILDFGTWAKDGSYVGPEKDWRFNFWLDRPEMVDKLGDAARDEYRAWVNEQKSHNSLQALADRIAGLPRSNEDTAATFCPPEWEDIVRWWDESVDEARNLSTNHRKEITGR